MEAYNSHHSVGETLPFSPKEVIKIVNELKHKKGDIDTAARDRAAAAAARKKRLIIGLVSGGVGGTLGLGLLLFFLRKRRKGKKVS